MGSRAQLGNKIYFPAQQGEEARDRVNLLKVEQVCSTAPPGTWPAVVEMIDPRV